MSIMNIIESYQPQSQYHVDGNPECRIDVSISQALGQGGECIVYPGIMSGSGVPRPVVLKDYSAMSLKISGTNETKNIFRNKKSAEYLVIEQLTWYQLLAGVQEKGQCLFPVPEIWVPARSKTGIHAIVTERLSDSHFFLDMKQIFTPEMRLGFFGDRKETVRQLINDLQVFHERARDNGIAFINKNNPKKLILNFDAWFLVVFPGFNLLRLNDFSGVKKAYKDEDYIWFERSLEFVRKMWNLA